jgi:hypothetical protein
LTASALIPENTVSTTTIPQIGTAQWVARERSRIPKRVSRATQIPAPLNPCWAESEALSCAVDGYLRPIYSLISHVNRFGDLTSLG